MTTTHSAALTAPQRAKLDAQLERWRQDLVDLTKRNKLLNFKHTKSSSLEVLAPSADQIHRHLMHGRDWSFTLPDDDPVEPPTPEEIVAMRSSDELAVDKPRATDVLRTLHTLERSANQTSIDTGLWILYLGFGMLRWIDPADRKAHDSPLLLVPVRIERLAPDLHRLQLAEDDPVINPAIGLKLSNEFGIELGGSDVVDLEPGAVVEHVRQAVAGQRDWSVSSRVVLSTFTFHKAVMYRDLLDNAEIVAEHPLVHVAAVGPSAPAAEGLDFEPPDVDRLDDLIPPEQLVSVRDADSSQRVCVLAARDGRSFVMDGPPGTGKSQTITNMIAELLHLGKKVLFVSEKAAALDVVRDRLAESGLSEFVLELHSHKATRKEVVHELGRSLESTVRATATFSDTDRADLVRARQALSAYAIAMNEVRSPLGRSLHDVLGRIVQLQHLAHAPVATAIDETLTPDAFGRILDAAGRLGDAWGPVVRGDGFLWRSLIEPERSGARLQQLESQLRECLAASDAVRRIVHDVDAGIGTGWVNGLPDAERLHHLVALVESNPARRAVPPSWLGTGGLDHVTALLAERQQQFRSHADAVSLVAAVVGDARRLELPVGHGAKLRTSIGDLRYESPSIRFEHADHASAVARILDCVDRTISTLPEVIEQVGAIATAFGIDDATTTIRRCRELAEIASLVDAPVRPEPAWLDPMVQAALNEASSVLTELVADYRARRDALRTVFTDDVLDLDLVSLAARLRSASGIKKLGGSHRADKKVLAVCVVTGKVDESVMARLDDAIAWQVLSQRLGSAEQHHGGLLGAYYQGPRDTDLERLERAVSMARRAVEIVGADDQANLVDQLALGGSPDPSVLRAGRQLAELLESWDDGIGPVMREVDAGIESMPIQALLSWAERVRPHLADLLDCSATVESVAGRGVQVTQCVDVLTAMDVGAQVEAELVASEQQDIAVFGTTWAGLDTDLEEMARRVEWARGAVVAVGDALSESAARTLLDHDDVAAALGAAIARFGAAWTPIAEQFEAPWRARLTEDVTVSFADGSGLVAELLGSTADIGEWARHVRARSDLADAGLGAVVEYCERHRIDAEHVQPVVERAVLEGWADVILRRDARIDSVEPGERDRTVQRFRELDRDLIRNAAAQVVTSCAAQRPSSGVGVAGVIRREANKRSRHMPIRRLLEETREVALALKPCFMMSPLSVSQFLPADMRFDVVIFDEASQVRPADAINCIYRGAQLIVAGDPRQLPPTSFFDQVTEEGTDEWLDEEPEDFESILDVCLGSGLPALSLDWHYRSRHESLITYSNYRFYDGALLTFPGAIDRADDVGVVLVHVRGVYRRGAGRDNPLEAAKVVERVLYHRRQHPDLTLGVVAFSTAQEAAIVAEIERQLDDHPELPDLLTDDRLDGFFVKNLENVQGDERDIIIFSIGYGPDEHGKFTEQLGPLTKRGGERRLNVAITRARRRIEVVSSVRSADFPGTSASQGVRHLQRYLDFAERGVPSLALDVGLAGGDAESPFEEEVLRSIAAMGFDAVPQVGVAGYRVDIGVRHPARPGEYVLGVECDGAAYHSSRVARDRDRLRQEVLEGLGWRIHRIWGPSWYHDRSAQEEVLRAAIEDAIAGVRQAPPADLTEPNGPVIDVLDAELDERPSWAVAYVEQDWSRPPSSFSEIVDVPRRELESVITGVVRVEGAIHEDLLRRRVLVAYAGRRLTARVKAAIDAAIAAAERAGSIVRMDRTFLAMPSTPIEVRVPDEGGEARTVHHVAPAERRLAIVRLVGDAHRVERNELLTAFSRLFGWKRAGNDITTAFTADLEHLVDVGGLRLEGEYVVPG